MKKTSSKNVFSNFVIALLICMGSAICFQAAAQENTGGASTGKLNTVRITIEDGFRYISTYGIPRHAMKNFKASGIKPQSYIFRVTAKPKLEKAGTNWEPDIFFGVALDGVPITQNVGNVWDDQGFWVMQGPDPDPYGGTKKPDGRYVYTAIPTALVHKSLTHIGYAADGFPIFVSQSDKFTSSYRLKEGMRPAPPIGPGGVYDGTYLSDYTYIPRSGVLDRCNGLKVKNKYYIYILGKEFPHVPLCWSGKPDQSFANNTNRQSQKTDSHAPKDKTFESYLRKRRSGY